MTKKTSLQQKLKIKADEWDGYASGLLSLPPRRTITGKIISHENNPHWIKGNDIGIKHRLEWARITGYRPTDYKQQLARDLTKEAVLTALLESSPCEVCPAYTICKYTFKSCVKFNQWAACEGNKARFPTIPARAQFIGAVPNGI